MMLDQPLEKEAASPALKYLISALAGGLAAGGGGYLASSRGKERPGETEEERRARILRNTLAMGGAGAVAGAAIPGAWDLASTSAPDYSSLEAGLEMIPPELRMVTGGVGGATVGSALTPTHAKVQADIDKATKELKTQHRATHGKLPKTSVLERQLRQAQQTRDQFLQQPAPRKKAPANIHAQHAAQVKQVEQDFRTATKKLKAQQALKTGLKTRVGDMTKAKWDAHGASTTPGATAKRMLWGTGIGAGLGYFSPRLGAVTDNPYGAAVTGAAVGGGASHLMGGKKRIGMPLGALAGWIAENLDDRRRGNDKPLIPAFE